MVNQHFTRSTLWMINGYSKKSTIIQSTGALKQWRFCLRLHLTGKTNIFGRLLSAWEILRYACWQRVPNFAGKFGKILPQNASHPLQARLMRAFSWPIMISRMRDINRCSAKASEELHSLASESEFVFLRNPLRSFFVCHWYSWLIVLEKADFIFKIRQTDQSKWTTFPPARSVLFV